MGEVQEQPANISVHEAKADNAAENANAKHRTLASSRTNYRWWFQMVIFSVLVLFGQSVATLLGRLYYEKGGNSKWMAALVLNAGFPVLLPLLFLSPAQNQPTGNTEKNQPRPIIIVTLYIFLGVFLAAEGMLYSIGLLYLPVSTYTLICATELGFNALFSYFLNSQKLTPFILNSLFLLTISSILLIFAPHSSDSNDKKGKYAIGFLCTVGASAGDAFLLSVTQLAFRKIFKRETFRVVLDMIIYESVVATCAILLGLFASGEWVNLSREMKEYKLGSLAYVMTLVGIAVFWQVFAIGAVGLIFKVSSLFSNVISAVGLPIVPVLAVFIFNDTMNGVKVVSMVLAIWGFLSYIYQHYLDDLKAKAQSANVDQVFEVPLIEKC